MKKNFFKYTVYFIILFTLLCICLNSTTRNVVLKYIEIHKLKKQTDKATKINLEYKKRLEYIQTKPFLMEKLTKQDLNVLAENEVEYHFDDYKDDTDEVKQ